MSEQLDAAADEITGPLVFSCIKCKTIVGDSYSLFHSNQEFKTITLSASSNIQRTNELYTSYQDHDHGSSYFCFICLNCQHALGRYYVTTNTSLDNIREKFTFDIDNISSYELGKAQHGKVVDQESVKAPGESTSESGLAEEVVKIQHVVLDLANRLSAVENWRDHIYGLPREMNGNGHIYTTNGVTNHHHVVSEKMNNVVNGTSSGSLEHSPRSDKRPRF